MLAPETEGVALVETGKRLAHGQGGANSLARVIVNIHRGVPKAMIESPMNLSSVPSLAITSRLRASRSVFRNRTTSVGERRSLISVKLRTSTNMIVSSRSSPPRRRASCVCSMR